MDFFSKCDQIRSYHFCAVRLMKYEVIMTGIHVDYRAPWLFAWPKKVSKIVTTIRHCFFFLEGLLYWTRNKKYHFKYYHDYSVNVTQIDLYLEEFIFRKTGICSSKRSQQQHESITRTEITCRNSPCNMGGLLQVAYC